MKTMRMNLLLIVILILSMILIVTAGGIEKANAGVRVQATLRTPGVRVHVDSGPRQDYREVRRSPARGNRHEVMRITKQDRRIAKRLAWYADTSKSELIRLRKQGYHWMEIGIWLELPRSTVHAAYHRDSWERYLRHGHRETRQVGHGPVRYTETRTRAIDNRCPR